MPSTRQIRPSRKPFPFRISELIYVRASGAVTGALSKPSGTPAAGGTGDLPLEGGDAEGDDESEEAPAVIGSPGS